MKIKQYLHIVIEVEAPNIKEFEEKVERLRIALSNYRYTNWIWTNEPRPGNPVQYKEFREE